MSLNLKYLAAGLLACLVLVSEPEAKAMPFNTDMFEVQPSADSVARKKPIGSISVGSLTRQKPDLNSEWVQKNPFEGKSDAIARGERKFQSNCSPCHGSFKDGVHVPSEIMSKGMPSVDVSAETTAYLDPGTNKNPKTDAHYFNYIFNGGALMPAYGYKFSNNDIWDIISYVRLLQAKSVKTLAVKK